MSPTLPSLSPGQGPLGLVDPPGAGRAIGDPILDGASSSRKAVMAPVAGLRGSTLTGVAWSVAGRTGQQVVGFAVSVMMARLLTPAEFGLIAMAAVFINFASTIVDAGLGDSLIQRRVVDDRHWTSAFFLSLAIGLAISMALLLAAPSLARFYSAPAVGPICRMLAWCPVLGALGTVPRAILRRRMKFRALATADVTATIAAGAVGIVLALAGSGALSLAASSVIGSAVTTGVVWAAAGWRPRGAFNASAIRDVARFGSGLVGFNVINYWARNLDNLVVGKILGASALGIYCRAYFLMLLPIQQVTSVIGSAMFPALASIQHDRSRVKDIFLRTLGAIALVSSPMVVGLFVIADSLVPALFGTRWVEVVPIFRILCVASLIQALCNPVGWIYTSQGRTDLLFWWGLFGSGSLVVAILIGAWFGTLASIAGAYAVANALLFYPCLAIPGRLIDVTFAEILRAVSGSFACSIVMGLVVFGVGRLLPAWRPWSALAVQVPIGMVAFVSLAHMLSLPAYRDLKGCWVRAGGLR